MAVCALTLTVLSLLISGSSANGAKSLCPDREQCSPDPCLNVTCPLYPHAICVPNNCGDSCEPAFFHKSNLEIEVTSKCNHTSCSNVNCPEKRVCIEELVPLHCPHHKCRHHVKARCVPALHRSPPSRCHQVSCPSGTVCHVQHTKSGKRAHCMNSKPSSCLELGPCEPGMVCKVRKGREHSVAHCVPKHSSSNPQDCSQVKCRKGFECVIFGSKHVRPRCVNQKPLPKTCSDLDCHSVNMSCHQTDTGPRCFVASQCHELSCAKDEYCTLTTYSSRNLTVAECVKQRIQHCDSHSSNPCVEDQICVSVRQKLEYPGSSQCLQAGCSNSSCSSPTHNCVSLPEQVSNIVGTSSLCLPSAYVSSLHFGTNCSSSNSVVCPTRGVRGVFSACHELSVGGVTIGTVCGSLSGHPSVSCEELECGEDKECVQKIAPGLSGDFSRTDCVSSRLIDKMF